FTGGPRDGPQRFPSDSGTGGRDVHAAGRRSHAHSEPAEYRHERDHIHVAAVADHRAGIKRVESGHGNDGDAENPARRTC
ncbi:hypothetical protein ACFE4E_004840, partial [Salmonella enterica]|nr:hypothetical protein [Salmonella enterica]EHM5656327.1 hypothetical protein [Salmonella enterica subsp. enterica serovar Poona]EGW7895344.1 hypothetical protein [Salmonella enterica]EHK5967541.1 hypothetical protein [Salmonella enterica]EHK6243984.1 hypothetical protein [Salmonella enterica]